MKYSRFEELPVWKDAVQLARAAFELTRHESFQHQYALIDQLVRAALSISNNIAEGFERGTTRELMQFIHYAKGSAGEVRSMCHVLHGLVGFETIQDKVASLLSLSESIGKQLGAWAASQRSSRINGSRYAQP
ncbi:MAG: four helix bundle protein [Kiritimatiellaeota bacterium]|nr:four helix bundle protein [Kiritimatiellota bacterium]